MIYVRFTFLQIFSLVLLLIGASVLSQAQGQDAPKTAIVVHGGAGTILPSNMTPETEASYRAKLEEALQRGYSILAEGGSSLDAVVATLHILEDSPLFNAGKGAVFTSEGTVELDASIMDGATRQAGAVAGVKHIRHPIDLARLVMEASPHVMMVGEGAEAFAQQHGMEMIPNDSFYTERRKGQLERVQQQEKGVGEAGQTSDSVDKKHGTVGAVALDQEGNLAAGTSTGGMTNKRFGRVGDSPIIGAGTYADNETCAVSATGHGEYFIRGVIAYDIAAMMRYANRSLEEAARTVIMDKLTASGGTGGVIALDREGHIAMPFNTPGMYRGYVDTEGNMKVEIYGGEE